MVRLVTYYKNGFRFKLILSDLRDYLNMRFVNQLKGGKRKNENRRKN